VPENRPLPMQKSISNRLFSESVGGKNGKFRKNFQVGRHTGRLAQSFQK